LHHADQLMSFATYRLREAERQQREAENSWRDIRGSGWGKVAETHMEDPRWLDFIAAVRSGDSPGLTWVRYLAELEHERPQKVMQAATEEVEPAARAPSKKALKLARHRQTVALINGQRTDGNAELQRRIQKRRQQQVEAEVKAMAARWRVNRGVAAALVPLLPLEL
jgi:hypothetical protein